MGNIDVSAYIDLLRRSMPYVPPLQIDEIRTLHRRREFGSIVRLVRSMMNIEAKITLHWIEDSPDKETPAWVRLPRNMPMYGTPAFKTLNLDMFILKSFARRSRCHEFVVVVAHELSHIVLASIQHPLREDEKAVDLTAMLLGFSYSYRLAAHVVRVYPGNFVRKSSIGYLTEGELNAACRILLPRNLRLRHVAIALVRSSWGFLILLGACIGVWLYETLKPLISQF